MPTPQNDNALRPGSGIPRPSRHLHRRHLPGRSDKVSPVDWGVVKPAAPRPISAGSRTGWTRSLEHLGVPICAGCAPLLGLDCAVRGRS